MYIIKQKEVNLYLESIGLMGYTWSNRITDSMTITCQSQLKDITNNLEIDGYDYEVLEKSK